MKVIDDREDEQVEGYKDDIDTLLVFAGLFSAVVTAFTIESYQWLQEGPADTSAALLNSTVTLLMQIAQQGSQSSSPSSFTPPSPPPPFTASSSVVRINTFWFLSLTLALIDALFGLLCKQWLREHKRQTNTQSPGQALALRWLRYRSFEEWHVPKILASLPILLEISLFLFFAGLLELLWTRHYVPFAIVLSVVGLAVLIYGITTLLPGITIIQQVLQMHPRLASGDTSELSPHYINWLPFISLICPFKSPQSWFTFQLLSSTYYLPGCKRVLFFLLKKFNQFWKIYGFIQHLDSAFLEHILSLSSWPSLDLNVIQRFSRINNCPNLYELKGFRWLVQETRDIPSMIPHLKNVLEELPVYLVMPTVFDDWVPPSESSLDSALHSNYLYNNEDHLFDDNAPAHVMALTSQMLFFHHFLETRNSLFEEDVNEVKALWGHIGNISGKRKLMESFFCPERFLMEQSQPWHVDLLNFYENQWSHLEVESRCQIVERLCKAILPFLEVGRENITSCHVASSFGLKFLTLLHSDMITTLSKKTSWSVDTAWMQIMDHIMVIHQLPLHYLKPIPGYFPVGLQGILNNPTTSQTVLRSFLDSHTQAWDETDHRGKRFLVEELTTNINTTVPHIQRDLDPALSTKKSEQLFSSHTPLITSPAGLGLLSVINNKFKEEPSLGGWCGEDTCQNWVDALERVRVFCRLKPDYFKAVPKYDWREIVFGYYIPKQMHGDGDVQVSGVQQSKDMGPVNLEGGSVQEAGSSHTQEATEDGMNGRKASDIGKHDDEKVGPLEIPGNNDSIERALGGCQQNENQVVDGPGADNNV